MLNRVRAKTQPCFMPFSTGKESENAPLSWALACMLPWDPQTMLINFFGQPNFDIISHKPSQLTLSKSFVRFMEVVYKLAFYSWDFSWSWRAAKNMSIVLWPHLKPIWLSGSRYCSKCSVKQFIRILAKIFPTMESREMPWWLLQSWQLLLRLYRWW